jgi:hypothetical protein
MTTGNLLIAAAFAGLAATVSGCQQPRATGEPGVWNEQKQVDERNKKYWEKHCCRRGGRSN